MSELSASSLQELNSRALSLLQRATYHVRLAQQSRLFLRFIRDIWQGRKPARDTFPPSTGEITEPEWVNMLRTYFHRSKRALPRDRHHNYVLRFGNAQLSEWEMGGVGLFYPPFDPSDCHYPYCLDDLSLYSKLPLSKGGPELSGEIAKRNEIILNVRNCKCRGRKHKNHSAFTVCRELDASRELDQTRGIPVHWRKNNPGRPPKWVLYYNDQRYRASIQRIISEVVRKEKLHA